MDERSPNEWNGYVDMFAMPISDKDREALDAYFLEHWPELKPSRWWRLRQWFRRLARP